MERSDHTKMNTRSYQSKKEKENEKEENRINLTIPIYLKDILPIEKWNSLSQQHQQDCIHILLAPNTFFYRSRPPWEVAKFGSLSTEEEKLFYSRLRIFKEEYGITNSLWGYFAIPFLGRVGYQMASFYRAKVKEGTIKDPILEKDHSTGKLRQVCEKPKVEVSSEIHEKLTREAAKLLAKQLCQMSNLSSITTHKKRETKTFDFILDEKSDNSSDSPSIAANAEMSTDDESFNTNKRRTGKKKNKKQTKPKANMKVKESLNKDVFVFETQNDKQNDHENDKKYQSEPIIEEEKTQNDIVQQTINDTKEEKEIKTIFESEEDYSMDIQSFTFDIPSIKQAQNQNSKEDVHNDNRETFQFKEIDKEDSKNEITSSTNRRSSELTILDSNCILVGARDPLTGRPMKNPAMNFDGYVMDYESWIMFLKGKATIPYDTSIESLNDLIRIDSQNYDSLKMNITNFTTM